MSILSIIWAAGIPITFLCLVAFAVPRLVKQRNADWDRDFNLIAGWIFVSFGFSLLWPLLVVLMVGWAGAVLGTRRLTKQEAREEVTP